MKYKISFILCIGVVLLLLVSCVKTERPFTAAELLDLGEKYLLELNYEQALVQFLKVIEIEPMNPHGYTGAAKAYIGLGQIYKAAEILQQGLEILPDETSIMSMLDELTEAPGQSKNSSTDVQLWDSFTHEQRSTLERLDYAAEAFDYETVYEIMTSIEFLEFYSKLGINVNVRDDSGSSANLKMDENWHWYLMYWDAGGENDNEKDYWWGKTNKNKMRVECQLWTYTNTSVSSIVVRHMSLIDGIENGEFEIIRYGPGQLMYYEGIAANGLHSGTETVTDMITGERFVFEYDEIGMCTNYLIDEHGNAYIQSEDGEGRRRVRNDHALHASTIH